MMMTPGVTSVAYSAPEMLQASSRCRRGNNDDPICYGTAVDVWAFGVTHFEVMTLDVFVYGSTTQEVLKSIAWRLGRQGSEASAPAESQDGVRAPLSTFVHLPGASLLQKALCWDPAERPTAATLWQQAREAQELALTQQAVGCQEQATPERLAQQAAECQQEKTLGDSLVPQAANGQEEQQNKRLLLMLFLLQQRQWSCEEKQ